MTEIEWDDVSKAEWILRNPDYEDNIKFIHEYPKPEVFTRVCFDEHAPPWWKRNKRVAIGYEDAYGNMQHYEHCKPSEDDPLKCRRYIINRMKNDTD